MKASKVDLAHRVAATFRLVEAGEQVIVAVSWLGIAVSRAAALMENLGRTKQATSVRRRIPPRAGKRAERECEATPEVPVPTQRPLALTVAPYRNAAATPLLQRSPVE